MLKKFFDFIYSAVFNVCKVLMAAQILLVSVVVFGRFVFNKTPGWGEESALLCMVWFCLLSATLAIRDDSHLRMTVIDMFIPEKAVRFLDKFNNVLIFGFAVFMAIEGMKLTHLTALNVMPGMGIKSSWLFASVPVTGIALILMLIEKVRGKA